MFFSPCTIKNIPCQQRHKMMSNSPPTHTHILLPLLRTELETNQFKFLLIYVHLDTGISYRIVLLTSFTCICHINFRFTNILPQCCSSLRLFFRFCNYITGFFLVFLYEAILQQWWRNHIKHSCWSQPEIYASIIFLRPNNGGITMKIKKEKKGMTFTGWDRFYVLPSPTFLLCCTTVSLCV